MIITELNNSGRGLIGDKINVNSVFFVMTINTQMRLKWQKDIKDILTQWDNSVWKTELDGTFILELYKLTLTIEKRNVMTANQQHQGIDTDKPHCEICSD